MIHAVEDRLLRLEGSLGPLQALAATSIMTFALAPKDGGTALVVTYRVAGNEAAGLQQLAGPVDGVIGEQVRRLVAYVETGKPDRPSPRPGRLVLDPAQVLRRRAGSRSARRRSSAPARRGAGCRPRTPGTARVTVSKPSRLTTWNWIQAVSWSGIMRTTPWKSALSSKRFSRKRPFSGSLRISLVELGAALA